MTLYVKSFLYTNLGEPASRHSLIISNTSVHKEVYLAVTVDRVFWLLLEPYLSDFAKVQLSENEGYVEKYYISARKTLVPSIISVTLNGRWKADIPFGPHNETSSFLELVEIIKSRLQQSGIPKLRCSFKL